MVFNPRIEDFDLVKGDVLGQGSGGKVYKATWRGLTVAVKEMLHDGNAEQLQEELAGLIRMRHPRLVLFLGMAIPTPDRVSIVSEYMPGGNLFQLLREKKIELTWQKRIRLAMDIARAMAYLHDSHKPASIHRALNSFNVLIDSEMHANISDYGLENLRKNSSRGAAYSQPLWLAPEAYKHNTYSKASDVYAFGIMFWELLTRKTPFYQRVAVDGDTVEVMEAICNQNLRPYLAPECPYNLQLLLETAWHRDPSKRPSFAQIVVDLHKLQKSKIDLVLFETAEETNANLMQIKIQTKDLKPWMLPNSELDFDKLIGHGSFGEVWSGGWRGTKVAIKKFQTHIEQYEVQAFLRELALMERVRGPNVVLFMGACLEAGKFSIVMEFCGKGNLFDALQDVGGVHIDFPRIICILRDICSGIRTLHQHSPTPVIHRDLKSMNILIDADWNCKVADFGLAQFKNDPDHVVTLQMGTPYWQAPECIERKEFTEQSDVYAFGMICWELFTRELPYPDLDPHQAAYAVVTENLRPEIPKFVPPGFTKFIQSCWHAYGLFLFYSTSFLSYE
jgi:serine/threonine protein kinase